MKALRDLLVGKTLVDAAEDILLPGCEPVAFSDVIHTEGLVFYSYLRVGEAQFRLRFFGEIATETAGIQSTEVECEGSVPKGQGQFCRDCRTIQLGSEPPAEGLGGLIVSSEWTFRRPSAENLGGGTADLITAREDLSVAVDNHLPASGGLRCQSSDEPVADKPPHPLKQFNLLSAEGWSRRPCPARTYVSSQIAVDAHWYIADVRNGTDPLHFGCEFGPDTYTPAQKGLELGDVSCVHEIFHQKISTEELHIYLDKLVGIVGNHYRCGSLGAGEKCDGSILAVHDAVEEGDDAIKAGPIHRAGLCLTDQIM